MAKQAAKAAAVKSPANRAETGENPSVRTRFQPGQSGNPTGRPKVAEEVREHARAYTKEAIFELAKLAGLVMGPDGETPLGKAFSESVQKAALDSLIDRAAGKPVQGVSGDDGDGELVIRIKH